MIDIKHIYADLKSLRILTEKLEKKMRNNYSLAERTSVVCEKCRMNKQCHIKRIILSHEDIRGQMRLDRKIAAINSFE